MRVCFVFRPIGGNTACVRVSTDRLIDRVTNRPTGGPTELINRPTELMSRILIDRIFDQVTDLFDRLTNGIDRPIHRTDQLTDGPNNLSTDRPAV